MAASVTSLRAGLAARLATITGLEAHAVFQGQVTAPAAVVDVELINFDASGARMSDDFLFVVTLMVGAQVTPQAQANLDAYLAGSGAASVKAAIEGDCTLGGAAQLTRVVGVRKYGLLEYAGVDYCGAEFVVEVMA